MLADLVQTVTSSPWAPALALLAGIVSFASPCVFPLVPGYLSFVSGTQVAAPDEEPRRPLLPILLFVSGFALVFTLLGAFSAVFVPVLQSAWGLRIAGLVVILFGVGMVLYAFRAGPAGLYTERRPFLGKVKPGVAGAMPLGMAFAIGWTPCIGPVLGAILLLAGSEGGGLRGAFLMLFYSLGLAIPFVLMGLGIEWLMRRLAWVKRHYRVIAAVSGSIMIVIGVLLITGVWLRLLAPVLRWSNQLGLPI